MSDDGLEFLGKGWAFPLGVDSGTGRFATASGSEDVEQSIRIILATSKGERVMRPDFGCGIHDLVFGAISTALVVRIKSEVKEALTTHEARIEILAVNVDASNAANGELRISIDYRHRTTNQSGNLVYPFYFSEAF